MQIKATVTKLQNKGMKSKNNPEGLFGKIISAQLAQFIGKTVNIEITEV